MKKLLISLLALAFLLGACGSDSGEAAEVDEELVAALASELGGEDSPMSDEEATCASEKIIGDIGNDRMVELGVSADNVSSVEEIDFTDSEIDTILDSFTGCFDLQAAMAAEFASDGTFSEEDATCIASELGDDQLKAAMRVGLVGEGESDPDVEADFQGALIDAFSTCDVLPG